VDHHWWQKLFKKQVQNDSGPEAAIARKEKPGTMPGVSLVSFQIATQPFLV
jgi:hypothetical protein